MSEPEKDEETPEVIPHGADVEEEPFVCNEGNTTGGGCIIN